MGYSSWPPRSLDSTRLPRTIHPPNPSSLPARCLQTLLGAAHAHGCVTTLTNHLLLTARPIVSRSLHIIIIWIPRTKSWGLLGIFRGIRATSSPSSSVPLHYFGTLGTFQTRIQIPICICRPLRIGSIQNIRCCRGRILIVREKWELRGLLLLLGLVVLALPESLHITGLHRGLHGLLNRHINIWYTVATRGARWQCLRYRLLVLSNISPGIQDRHLRISQEAAGCLRVVRALIFRLLVYPIDFRVALLHVKHRYALEHLRIWATFVFGHGGLLNTFGILTPDLF